MNYWRTDDSPSSASATTNAAAADLRLENVYRSSFADIVSSVRRAFGPAPPEPEDVVQAAFLKYAAHKNPASIKDPSAFVFITARNIIFDQKRRNKVFDRYLADQMAYNLEFRLEEITPERVLVSRERFSQMVTALKCLPKKQQVILAMSRVEGKTYAEISSLTGWSESDVCRQLKAGMKCLAKEMRAVRKVAASTGTDMS